MLGGIRSRATASDIGRAADRAPTPQEDAMPTVEEIRSRFGEDVAFLG